MTASEMRAHERANILAALAACSGKVFGPGGAAEMLDIKPTTLASRIKALGITNAARPANWDVHPSTSASRPAEVTQLDDDRRLVRRRKHQPPFTV
jgi:hypothetical protein